MSANTPTPRGDDASLVKTKRQRTHPPGGEQTKGPMFYFVDSNSSISEKRAHVMRRYLQDRRSQRRSSDIGGGTPPDRATNFRKNDGERASSKRNVSESDSSDSSLERPSSVSAICVCAKEMVVLTISL